MATTKKSTRPRRSAASTRAPGDNLLDQLTATGSLEVVSTRTHELRSRRGPDAVALKVDADAPAGELRVLMARHPSGAISFHFPTTAPGRRGTASKTQRLVFSVPINPEPAVIGADGKAVRRGFLTGAIKTVILKITAPVVKKAMPIVGLAAEAGWWKLRKLSEGWKKIDAAALTSNQPLPSANLAELSADPNKPNLLLIHGTFSNARSAYQGLASTHGSGSRTFLELTEHLYGGRVFAYDHFTVSRTPEDNVKAMLDALPNRTHVVDVITHSRGGLVLRQLAELTKTNKLAVRNVVLVAAPNDGTPLATPGRWDSFVTWIANIIDMFPDNPFTTGASFVADGLGWIANNVLDGLPGLHAMNRNGDIIQALQAGSGPPEATRYSALVANFEPDANLLKRMADAGVDKFFQTANDLVVPSEGGWQVDPGTSPVIPADRIGCFGRGGNIINADAARVIHTNFFGNSDTIDFLARALKGDPHPNPPIDPATTLPFGRRRGGGTGTIASPAPGAVPVPVTVAGAQTVAIVPAAGAALSTAMPAPPVLGDETFYLTIMYAPKETLTTELQATFRNARVMVTIPKKDRVNKDNPYLRRIIDRRDQIRGYVNGDPDHQSLPTAHELRQLGEDLFRMLFPPEVRYLYDLARAEQRTGRLNIVLTSYIPWMADFPWEFAFDPIRQTYISTSEANFTRNVVTQVPAQQTPGRVGPLRILVVNAQPVGSVALSVEEETGLIRSGFRNLIDAGLANVDVVLDATPAKLHEALEFGEYDILHYVGHGEFDFKLDKGFLLFQTTDGGEHKLDATVLKQLACRRGLRLVFLNACESGRGGFANFNQGVAPALIEDGVPTVVANQYSVLDISATAFAGHLYWALAHGNTVGDAVREARIAVNYSLGSEAIDWAVPVVYARNPADRICAPETGGAAARILEGQAAAAEVAKSRRRAAASRKRIAFWDVNRSIPNLREIAARLTGAQSKFLFEVVEIQAPLGTWRTEKREGERESTAYLYAERVAEKLAARVKQLGVDRLVAITTLPLRGKVDPTLHGWDDTDLSLFSTWELASRINGGQLSVERMIANLAQGVMVYESEENADSHARGEKACPMYRNSETDIRYIAGPTRLCDACRKKLAKADREVIPAIDAIAAAY